MNALYIIIVVCIIFTFFPFCSMLSMRVFTSPAYWTPAVAGSLYCPLNVSGNGAWLGGGGGEKVERRMRRRRWKKKDEEEEEEVEEEG